MLNGVISSRNNLIYKLTYPVVDEMLEQTLLTVSDKVKAGGLNKDD